MHIISSLTILLDSNYYSKKFSSAGHGDGNGRNVPTLVRDISGVGSVSCGAAHTLALSADGKTVWSFGSGDQGKLGHGDTARVHRPKVIEALQGVYVRKVAAASQFSLALTSNGQVSHSCTWLSGNVEDEGNVCLLGPVFSLKITSFEYLESNLF